MDCCICGLLRKLTPGVYLLEKRLLKIHFTKTNGKTPLKESFYKDERKIFKESGDQKIVLAKQVGKKGRNAILTTIKKASVFWLAKP